MAWKNPAKYPWAEIAAYFEAGHSRKECRLRYGFCDAMWYVALKNGSLILSDQAKARHPYAFRSFIYDWPEVQRYYDEGHTVRQCMARFGFSMSAWCKASRQGYVKARSVRPSLEGSCPTAWCMTTLGGLPISAVDDGLDSMEWIVADGL